jgi:hypothetical protein
VGFGEKLLREGGCPVIRHHIARARQGDDDVVALHFDAQVDIDSCHTLRAAAAGEASVAAKVPAVAAVKSLPDRLYGWQPN